MDNKKIITLLLLTTIILSILSIIVSVGVSNGFIKGKDVKESGKASINFAIAETATNTGGEFFNEG